MRHSAGGVLLLPGQSLPGLVAVRHWRAVRCHGTGKEVCFAIHFVAVSLSGYCVSRIAMWWSVNHFIIRGSADRSSTTPQSVCVTWKNDEESSQTGKTTVDSLVFTHQSSSENAAKFALITEFRWLPFYLPRSILSVWENGRTTSVRERWWRPLLWL